MPSSRWWRKATLYAWFADEPGLDWSLSAAEAAYEAESRGSATDPRNGYAHGKKMLGVTASVWEYQLRNGLVCKFEFFLDAPWIVQKDLEQIVRPLGPQAGHPFMPPLSMYERLKNESHGRLALDVC
jgi:hypothetical protein